MHRVFVFRTKLMFTEKVADESFEHMAGERMSTSGMRAVFERPRVNSRVYFCGPQSVAGMSLSALLYYVLFGEGRVEDELS